MNHTEELEDQVRRLSRTVDEMKMQLARLSGGIADTEKSTRRSSRRGFLRLGGAALLGSIGMAAAKVMPASAATGGNFVLGQANVAENPTTIQADGGGGVPIQVLAAESSAFSSSTQATAGTFNGPLQGLGGATGNVEGVNGWAQGASAFGVWGLTDAGTGVTGESATGIGLWARRSGRIRQDGLLAAGTPGYTPNDFELVRDSTGAPYVSVAGGVWRQVLTDNLGLQMFPNPRRIWDGFAQPQAAGTYGPIDATLRVASQGGGVSGVPAGAKAAYCAVQSYNAGVMTIYPDGTSNPLIANWTATANGPLNLHYMLVPLSAGGKFWFAAYFTGVKVFDAWGYLT